MGFEFSEIIFGKEYGLVVAPPLAGGLAAMDIMVTAANEIGRNDLAIISALVFSIQGLLGYPIMTYALRKQSNFVLGEYNAGNIKLKKENELLLDMFLFDISDDFKPYSESEMKGKIQ